MPKTQKHTGVKKIVPRGYVKSASYSIIVFQFRCLRLRLAQLVYLNLAFLVHIRDFRQKYFFSPVKISSEKQDF